MKTFIKWVLFLLIALLAVAVVVPVAATFLVEQEEVKARISAWVEKNTGRKLVIKGEVGFEPGLELRLYAEDVHLSNPSWASRPDAFSARRLELTMGVLPLLSRQVEIDSVLFSNARLWVEHDPQSGSNLQLFPPKGEARPVPAWFGIKQIGIEDSLIEAVATRSGRVTKVTLADARLSTRSSQLPIDIHATGALNGIEVQLDGTASTLATILSRQPTKMLLSLTTPAGDQIDAQGRIEDVLRWSGIKADVAFKLSSVPHYAALFSAPPLDIRQLGGSAVLEQPGKVSSMTLQQIEGRFRLQDLDFSLDGAIGNLARLEQFNLAAVSDDQLDFSKRLPKASADRRYPLADLSIAIDITGSSRATRIDVTTLKLTSGDVTITGSGGFEPGKGSWSEALDMQMTIPALAPAGEQFGLALPETGSISVAGQLRMQDKALSLTDIVLTGGDKNITFTASGSLNDILANRKGEIRYQAEARPDWFAQSFFNLPMLPQSTVLDGTLQITEEKIVNLVDQLTVELPGGRLLAEGVINDLSAPGVMQLDLVARIDDWSGLSSALSRPLPDIGAVELTGRLIGEGDAVFHLRQILGEKTTGDGGTTLTGNLENLGPQMKGILDFSFAVPWEELVTVLPGLDMLQRYHTADRPVTGTGVLLRKADGIWSIEELQVQTSMLGAGLELSGTLDSLVPLNGLLSASLQGTLNDRLRATIPSLPEIDTVVLETKLPVVDGVWSVVDLNGSARSEIGTLDINSKQLVLGQEWRGEFNVDLSVTDIKPLLPKVQIIRDNVPLTAKINLQLSPKKVLAVSSLNSGESDFTGTILFDQSAAIPRLEIDGESQRLDVSSILLPPPKETRFFSVKSIFPLWMDQYDGSVQLVAKHFSNEEYDLDNLDAAVSYDDQDVVVRISADRGPGSLTGNLHFPSNRNSRISIITSALPITAFRALLRKNIFQGGTIDMNVNLYGPGNNVSEILAGGNGAISFDINDSSIKSGALDTVGGDLFSNVLQVFNPFIERDKLVNVQCGAIRLDIADGKAITRKGLAMKTDRVTLLGGGEVTIDNEAIRIEIAPKPRKGFGISASSFAKMIRLGGTLSNPDVEASATGFFKSGAAIGAAIASGGLSLLGQGLLDRLTANADVCAVARGEIEKVPEQFDDVRGR